MVRTDSYEQLRLCMEQLLAQLMCIGTRHICLEYVSVSASPTKTIAATLGRNRIAVNTVSGGDHINRLIDTNRRLQEAGAA
jgi:hypothetical protein